MAEPWTIAFGRYLRMLRERRGLSLDDVCALSQPSVDKLSKGYLSRCEHGQHRIGFSKVIPLCRIYEIPADALMERMELDLELERVGPPETAGLSFGELVEAGNKSLTLGYQWPAYGFVRECLVRAPIDPAVEPFRDTQDQIGNAVMRVAIAARALGKIRFALHEFLYLRQTDLLSPRFRPIVPERLAVCYRVLGEHKLAEDYADAAIAEAEREVNPYALGFAYASRARVAATNNDPGTAVRVYHRAFKAFQATGRTVECATILNNLAQCYFDLGRLGAARRACLASQKLSGSQSQGRAHALSHLLLGDIDEREQRPEAATRRWQSVVGVAKQLNDRELRFKAEFALFRHAVTVGDFSSARAIHRRLRRLLPWLPPNTHEAEQYSQLVAKAGNELLLKRVAGHRTPASP